MTEQEYREIRTAVRIVRGKKSADIFQHAEAIALLIRSGEVRWQPGWIGNLANDWIAAGAITPEGYVNEDLIADWAVE